MDKGRARSAGIPRNCIGSAPKGLQLQPGVIGRGSLKADIYAGSLRDFNSKVEFDLVRGRFGMGAPDNPASQAGVDSHTGQIGGRFAQTRFPAQT